MTSPGGQTPSGDRVGTLGDQSADDRVVLRAVDIAKTYGATRALKGVAFEVRPGKVTVLFGENGAGKSTLMKIMAGIEPSSTGHLELDGEVVEFDSPTEAEARGISIIHQELNLCPNLSVSDNLFLGRELRTRRGAVDDARQRDVTHQLMARLEEDIDPSRSVKDLRLGQQQLVEIARALQADARILIMDEPTSALSATEIEVLFRVIRELTAQDVAIVYISHHLEEALEIADHAVVFRDGELVAADIADNIDLRWVVENMTGRSEEYGFADAQRNFREPLLTLEHVDVVDVDSGRLAVHDFSLQVRAGEIVCLYGLMGAGRTELLEAIAGRGVITSGRVRLAGDDLAGRTLQERIRSGLGLVPEDRQRDGLVQSLSVGRNLSLASIASITKNRLIAHRREKAEVGRQISDVRIKTAGPDVPITSLSGGNQQKVSIGKMLMTGPRVLLLDEPARGIDVGAKGEIFSLLFEQAERGLAVLYATSELNEALESSHRIVVMSRGRIVGQFDPLTGVQLRVTSGREDMDFLLQQGSGKVAIISAHPSNPYWQAEIDTARAAAEALGYDTIVDAHENDPQAQRRLVDDAVSQGVVAIILDPAGADESVGAVQKATDAGIPVFLVNAEIGEQGIAKSQIVSNNAQGATLGAQAWADAVGGEGTYVELFGNPTDNNARVRSDAYAEVLSQFPDLVKVGEETANWDRTQGRERMEILLSAHPDISGVISGNDEMALGAIQALKDAGRLDDVVVLGFDGNQDAVDAVAAGEMVATVLQPIVQGTQLAVEQMHRYLLTGETGEPEKQALDCVLITPETTGKFKNFSWRVTREDIMAASGEQVETTAASDAKGALL
jgi:erythritol transport system ATP-binding protein